MASIEKTVLAHEQRLYQAQLSSDVDGLDELIAEDLLFSGPDGRLFTKEQDLAMHRTGAMRIRSLEPKETTVRVLSAEAAVVSVVAAVKGDFDGEAAEGLVRYLRVWVLREGRWLIVAGSLQPIVEG